MSATVSGAALMERLVELSGPVHEPDPEMADLAAVIRTLLAVEMGQATRVHLGGNLFDAVITAAGPQARRVMAVMDAVQSGCGPVIEDPEHGWLYWLVPPGSAGQWAHHPHAVCLGHPHTITLPPLARITPPGPYWLRPSASDRLVPLSPLREALAQLPPGPPPHAALAAHLGATP